MHFLKWIVAIYFLCFFCSCKNKSQGYEIFKTVAFDTEVTVKVAIQKGLNSDALFKKISARILELEKAASLYLDDSELSLLNKNGTLKASSEFLKMVRFAIKAGDETKGDFDVSIQPLWDFYQGKSKYSTIDEALHLVNYQNIKIENGTVILKPGMKLSFNGFIQGYATDVIYTILRSEGVQSSLINGGEYRAIGKDNGSPWKVTIRTKNGREVEELELADSESIAVSAGYGYIFLSQGDNSNTSRKQSHIFSPKNQTQVINNLTYVVKTNGENAASIADVFSTTAAVVGEEIWRRNYSEEAYQLFLFK